MDAPQGLRTARLTLRAARPDDLADLFEVFGDAQTMRFWSSAADQTPEQTKPRLDRMIAAAQTPPLTVFVLERDGKVIGTAGWTRATDVGFILHRDHWRQGLMREAMAAILPHLWAVLDLPELTAEADPLNAASLGLLQSLGFRIIGRAEKTFCINGIWSDSVYLALPRPTVPGAAA
jgi:[ribosomal protein S5]-alanine N-acetyltransferase